MNFKNIKLGVALCGSYCTYDLVFKQIEILINKGVDIYPIMSENSYVTDTRFGSARSFISRFENLSGKKVIHTIVDAEPLGPKDLIDCLLIAPCTGNTLAKLSNAITDTCVTMASKGLMRNNKPIIIALATNDGLGLNFKNIANLRNCKNIHFVPFSKDDPVEKPNSLVANMDLIPETIQQVLIN